jgi:FG-GAP-like repeat/Abnormal spindle-like microcephaly-assoc'd, ASPM-SPD-2-Hydin
MSCLQPFRFRRVLCVWAALVAVAGAFVPAWAQFETRATDKFPQGADCIALGDFNNDGILDVVMTTDNGFTVALGNGDGTFQKPVTTRTALSYSLAVADFNNDGNLDIVVADDNQDPSTVSVYLGNGDGTFKPPINSRTTSYNEFIAVGDFNNDGKMDIVVIENPYISVLLGNGDGTFQPPSNNDSFVGAHWLAVADFNNDHKLDVVVTGEFGATYSIGVLLGNGNGTLQDSITQDIEYVPATVAAGDMNGDGNVDAVLSYDLGGVAVFLGNGDGTLQAPVNYDTSGISYYMVVGDLNLDGKLDVVVTSFLGTGPVDGMDVFWGNGDGTLQPAQFFASSVSGLPAVGDVNGDHLPDIALGDEDYGVGTMLNTGVVSFSPSTAPITFPVQLVNTTSSRQTVKLTNNGTAALSIDSVKLSGEFQMGSACGKTVAAGASCSISAEFEPKSAGNFTGLITIADSASSKPQFVELTGSATAVKLAPSSLSFGSQTVGTAGTPQVVTATNEGSAAVTFASIGLAGQKNFSESDDCSGQTIQPGASCTASVTFDPAKTGTISGYLYFNLPTGSVSPAPVVLFGTGT